MNIPNPQLRTNEEISAELKVKWKELSTHIEAHICSNETNALWKLIDIQASAIGVPVPVTLFALYIWTKSLVDSLVDAQDNTSLNIHNYNWAAAQKTADEIAALLFERERNNH